MTLNPCDAWIRRRADEPVSNHSLRYYIQYYEVNLNGWYLFKWHRKYETLYRKAIAFVGRNSTGCSYRKSKCSGDGAGCSARLLKKYGARVVGGLHILMPDSVCDVKLLKKSVAQNKEIVKAADHKIEKTAEKIKNGKYPHDGIYFYDRIAGIICQRLWCYGKTKDYAKGLKISTECIGCGLCEKLCPMGNLHVENGKAVAENRCTMCYRCISSCPKKAITLLGNEVVEQCRYEKYRADRQSEKRHLEV